jgi:hypothetical protein
MTATNTTPQGSAAPQAPAASSASPTPANGAPQTPKPAETPAAQPAAPAKPALDTKAIVENRKLKMELEQLRKAREAEAADVALAKKIRDPKTRYEAAQEAGLDYSEWTQKQLESLRDKKEDEGAKLPPEAQAALDELKADKKAREEAAAKEQQSQARAGAVAAANEFVKQNAETLPLISAFGAGEALMEAYAADAKKSGPRDEMEFAQEYEAMLETTIERNLTAIIATGKGKTLIQRLLGTPTAPNPTANPKQADPKAAAPTTRALTNGHSSETPPATDPRTLPAPVLQKRAARHFE